MDTRVICLPDGRMWCPMLVGEDLWTALAPYIHSWRDQRAAERFASAVRECGDVALLLPDGTVAALGPGGIIGSLT